MNDFRRLTHAGNWNYFALCGNYRRILFDCDSSTEKEEKQHQALVNAVAVGDSILTTSGFYGVVIDMTDEVVIVEFGSNKNCRIPMQKSAIVEVDKAEEA